MRERDRDRETERFRDRETERQRERERHTHTRKGKSLLEPRRLHGTLHTRQLSEAVTQQIPDELAKLRALLDTAISF